MHKELVQIRELMGEQFEAVRRMAAVDKNGTSLFFIARGDHVGMFVVRDKPDEGTPKERLFLCKIVEVIDDPKA